MTWDEHGGFYDHAAPPAAGEPGDNTSSTWPGPINQFGFAFNQYGPRVPAVVVSPLVPQNIIDHRLYDHTSVTATVETVFGLGPLTNRDGTANNVTSLCSLSSPRTNCPTTLPNPASAVIAPRVSRPAAAVSNLVLPANQGNLPGFLHVAVRDAYHEACRIHHDRFAAQLQQVKTRADARQLLAYCDSIRKAGN